MKSLVRRMTLVWALGGYRAMRLMRPRHQPAGWSSRKSWCVAVAVRAALALCAAPLLQGCIPLKQPEPDLVALVGDGETSGQRTLVLPLVETSHPFRDETWRIGEPKILDVARLAHTRGLYAETTVLPFHPLGMLPALLPQDTLLELCLVFEGGEVQSIVHRYTRNAFSPWVTQTRGRVDRKWLTRLEASVRASERVAFGMPSAGEEGARCFTDVRGPWFNPAEAALPWTGHQRNMVLAFLSRAIPAPRR